MRLLVVLRRGGEEGSGMIEDMEAWEARIFEAVSQASSKAEQSYMKKSRFDSIDFWRSLVVLFKSSTLFFLDYFIKPEGEHRDEVIWRGLREVSKGWWG